LLEKGPKGRGGGTSRVESRKKKSPGGKLKRNKKKREGPPKQRSKGKKVCNNMGKEGWYAINDRFPPE